MAAHASMLPSLAPALERDLPEECPECGSDDIIEDWSQGQSVCRACGLVIQESLVDLGAEWRTFTNEEGEGDTNRAAGPANPLLESGPSTSFSAEGGRGGMSISLNRAQQMHTISAADRFLISDVFPRISRIAEHGNITHRVRDRTNEIFKLYYDKLTLLPDGTRARSLRDEETVKIIAGAIFLACRNEGSSRTFKEVAALTRVETKEIGRSVRQIEQAVPSAKGLGRVESNEDAIARFCNRLNLPRDVTNAASELVERARELQGVHGRAYPSVAAACIFIVCQLSRKENRRTSRQISEVIGSADVTIRTAYRLIHPHLKQVLPQPHPAIVEPLENLAEL